MSSIVSVKSVSKQFKFGDTKVQALREISLDFEEGAICALMGPSGSGKSTLLNLIGLLDEIDSGEILISGTNIDQLNRDSKALFRNEKIGFIFQNFNLIPVLTTIENVTLPRELSPHLPKDGVKNRAEELLSKVGLGDQINQPVNKLSGGQMQRVAIARALINQPKLILADEPTANLDHEIGDTVLSIMKDLCLKEGATIIIATHDSSILDYCNRIVKLKDGILDN